MQNEALIKEIYEKVYFELRTVLEQPNRQVFFLTEGILFNYLYHKRKGSLDSYTDFDQHIEVLASYSVEMQRKFFHCGKAAVDWFFSFLNKEGVIGDEDWEFLRSTDNEQAEFALGELKRGNYDLLHGAIGIAYYLLYERGNEFEDYFKNFILELSNLCDKSASGMIEGFDLVKSEVIPNEVNLGLAHGIPSILKFCLSCYTKEICPNESEKVAKKVISYLLDHVRLDYKGSCLPFIVVNNRATSDSGRLAWCYGDLGAGFILYQAGITFNDKILIEFSIKLLKNTTLRTSQVDTGINDAGFCHGTSGAAYIYHKLWVLTSEVEFKKASDRWLEQTIKLVYDQERKFKHVRDSPDNMESDENYTMLQGTIGVGLVLHSLLTNVFDWDYYFMLN